MTLRYGYQTDDSVAARVYRGPAVRPVNHESAYQSGGVGTLSSFDRRVGKDNQGRRLKSLYGEQEQTIGWLKSLSWMRNKLKKEKELYEGTGEGDLIEELMEAVTDKYLETSNTKEALDREIRELKWGTDQVSDPEEF